MGFSIYEMDKSSGNTYDYKADFYNAGIFLRKYKNIGAAGFYLFVQGGLGGSYLKQKQEDSNSGFFDQTKRVTVGNCLPGYFLCSKQETTSGNRIQ